MKASSAPVEKKPFSAPVSEPGLTSTPWNQLNWYVQFVMHDFDNLNNGDLLNAQEEVTALCRVLEPSLYRPLLTTAELMELQEKISKPLVGMVDKGRADFGEFSYSVIIYRLRDLAEKDSSMKGVSSSLPEQVTSKTFTSPQTPVGLTSLYCCII